MIHFGTPDITCFPHFEYMNLNGLNLISILPRARGAGRFAGGSFGRESLLPIRQLVTFVFACASALPTGCREMTQLGNLTVDATLDATGLLCPLPVLKARRALKPLAPGAVLEVLATDPGATQDFQHFCQTTGCELLEASEQPGGVLRFIMRKPG
jgi:tRNA 2-thiouridine synthesizing protein A